MPRYLAITPSPIPPGVGPQLPARLLERLHLPAHPHLRQPHQPLHRMEQRGGRVLRRRRTGRYAPAPPALGPPPPLCMRLQPHMPRLQPPHALQACWWRSRSSTRTPSSRPSPPPAPSLPPRSHTVRPTASGRRHSKGPSLATWIAGLGRSRAPYPFSREKRTNIRGRITRLSARKTSVAPCYICRC